MTINPNNIINPENIDKIIKIASLKIKKMKLPKHQSDSNHSCSSVSPERGKEGGVSNRGVTP